MPFPWKLYQLLEDATPNQYDHIVSWSADGTSFRVHKIEEFTNTIMKDYFRQKHFKSFTRQVCHVVFCFVVLCCVIWLWLVLCLWNVWLWNVWWKLVDLGLDQSNGVMSAKAMETH